jgi:hypothetical protein
MKDFMPQDLATQVSAAANILEVPRPPQSPGMAVRFLRADVSKERSEWLALWAGWSGREIMAHPAYARLFARPEDRVVGAVAKAARGGIIYPIILRPLAAEPWLRTDEATWDATTPYGYGGPFAWGVTPAEASLFWEHVDAWAREQQVITSFARLPLFPEASLPFDGTIDVIGPCVIRRLDLPEEEIWADYSSKVRQNIQRARRLGLTVEADLTGKRLDEFLAVYTATMNRRGATQNYYFPKAFYEAIATGLEDHFAFFHLVSGGRVISSELVLFAEDHAYSFLGGSFEDACALRANELLKHESFLWCRNAGLKSLILGGGYKGQDGILRFKRSFASSGELPFRVGKRTYDAVSCDRLVESRSDWEKSRSVAWQPDPHYFPPYRS